MNGSYLVLLMLVLALLLLRRKRWMRAVQHLKRTQRVIGKERERMRELAQRLLGKDCYVNLVEGTADGILREVTAGGLVLEKDGKLQIVNLDYVVRLREYPYNKKGKRATMFG